MHRLNALLTLAVTIGLVLTGCDSIPTESNPSTEGESAAPQAKNRPAQRAPQNVLEVTAIHQGEKILFELSDEEIRSGWTTLQFNNQTDHTHFVYINRPDELALKALEEEEGEITREAWMDAVNIPFQEAWDPYFSGQNTVVELFADLGANLPGWFFTDVRVSGGAGLTSAGETSRTTLDLEPGTYFIECYVLGENGVFHSTSGMVEKLEVTDASSGAREPKPTLNISISTDDGIEVDGAQGPSGIRPGQHTVAVTFEDNMVYGHGLGHDIHLIRLDDGTTLDEVGAWVDYLDVGADGFYADNGALTSTDANPGPQTFLGGVQDIQPPLPETAYFHVQLKPGDYAWVAEVPNPESKDMLNAFSVP